MEKRVLGLPAFYCGIIGVMLAKKYRFHSRGGVRYTYQNGRSLRNPKVSLVFNRNSKGRQRFAVVVSKKVLKSAVGRNRIRRRIYEVIRGELANITKPVDCIFVVYSNELQNLPFAGLRVLVRDLLKQAEII
jgi:ribonuclease P protein component